MRTLTLAASGVILILLASCATTDFKPYIGQQQDWPTAPGSFMKPNNTLPVYFGLPDKPYSVLGFMDCETSPAKRKGVIDFAAREAKDRGADALIVLEQGLRYAGESKSGTAETTFSGGSARTTYEGTSLALFSGTSKVLLIKFRNSLGPAGGANGLSRQADSQTPTLPITYDPNLDPELRLPIQTEIASEPPGIQIEINGSIIGRTPLIYVFRQDEGHHFLGNATVRAIPDETNFFVQEKYFLDPNFPSLASSDPVPRRIQFDMKNQIPEPKRKAGTFRVKSAEEKN